MKTAEEMALGFPHGQIKRAQNTVKRAKAETFLQAADEVEKLLTEESLAAIAAWVAAVRMIAMEEV
jgi:hypothetical protein